MSDVLSGADEPFQIGDPVRAVSGEFTELDGVVAELRNEIVIVEFEIFGQNTPVEFASEDLRHIDG